VISVSIEGEVFSVICTLGAIDGAGCTGSARTAGSVTTAGPVAAGALSGEAATGIRFGGRRTRSRFFDAVFMRAPCFPPPSAETSNVNVTRRPARSSGILIARLDTTTCLGNSRAGAFPWESA
jgi:hypothetical protein